MAFEGAPQEKSFDADLRGSTRIKTVCSDDVPGR